MSLRKQAKILGISPTYLSLLLNGKRPWRGNLKERYEELVNTFVNTQEANTLLTKASEDDFVPEAKHGGAAGTRTPCLFNAIEALSQMSYSPTNESGGVLTTRLNITNRNIVRNEFCNVTAKLPLMVGT